MKRRFVNGRLRSRFFNLRSVLNDLPIIANRFVLVKRFNKAEFNVGWAFKNHLIANRA